MGLFDGFDEFEDYEEISRASYRHAPTKYCGNKLESLPYILPHLPYLDTFVDLFGGSGQVLFSRKKRGLEIYNDRHSGLAAFYRVLQDKVMLDEFFERVQLLQHSRELFYAFREEYQKEDQSLVDRAVKWYYLAQTSFGGKGIEFGRVKKGKNDLYNKITTYFPDFEYFHERLKGVIIENLDWEQCIKDYDGYTTVIFCDPPYYDSNQYVHTMSRGDHKRLLDTIFNSKGYFAISGYDNDLYSQYPWSDVHCFEVRENFQPSDQLKKRSEMRLETLWIKESDG